MMMISEEYQAYKFKILLVGGAMVLLSSIGAALAVAIRIFYMIKLHKSLVRAAGNVQSAGRVLKRAILDPAAMSVIATGRGVMEEKEATDEYDILFNKPVKLCASLFGIDSVTKDFVKYYDSKLLIKTHKKGKKEAKKSKSSGPPKKTSGGKKAEKKGEKKGEKKTEKKGGAKPKKSKK